MLQWIKFGKRKIFAEYFSWASVNHNWTPCVLLRAVSDIISLDNFNHDLN